MTAFRSVVLEHFRHPHNHGPVEHATVSVEGANPLCGDRMRLELRVEGEAIAAAGFTANACAICIAASSVLTDRIRGMDLSTAERVEVASINAALGGEPPRGRERCASLPLDTLRKAIGEARAARS